MIEPDTKIDNRYHVLSRVGSGGMADVYLAEDELLGRKVAVKVLHHRFAEDQEFVERFRREASSAAGLSHPNVVAVFDRGEWDGTYYIAMEYLPGRSLKALVREGGPLTPAAAIDVIVQVLRAARFAHRRGVIHRDIKPHNVILDEEGRAKVTDFGIARAGASDMTLTGSIMGTAQYLSPEQAQGQAVSESSDLYAIGVVLYELLTGAVPFDGETAVAIALKQVSAEPRAPSEINPVVPPALDAIVARALAKDPAARFPDADQFIAALQEVRQTMPGPPLEPELALAHGTSAANGDPAAVAAAAGVAAAGLAAPATGAGTPLAPEHLAAGFVGLPEGPGLEDAAGNGSTVPTAEQLRLRRRRWWWLALVVPAAIVIAALAFVLLAPASSVRVPDVRGRAQYEAMALLKAKGFDPRVSSAASNWVAGGLVITQEPLPGNFLARGSRVLIVVSRGPGAVMVPAVGGYSLARARQIVREAGLTPVARQQASNTVARGLVISTQPNPNARVAHGGRVTLLVSSGPERVQAPSVVGKTLAEAESALAEAGLKVGVIKHRPSPEAEPGTVLSQSPGPGAGMSAGGMVNLVVAKTPSSQPVPSVVGQEVSQARAVLHESGFHSRKVSRQITDPALVGLVVEQDPSAGQHAPPGTTVTLVVGVQSTTTTSTTTTSQTTTTSATTTAVAPPPVAPPPGQ